MIGSFFLPADIARRRGHALQAHQLALCHLAPRLPSDLVRPLPSLSANPVLHLRSAPPKSIVGISTPMAPSPLLGKWVEAQVQIANSVAGIMAVPATLFEQAQGRAASYGFSIAGRPCRVETMGAPGSYGAQMGTGTRGHYSSFIDEMSNRQSIVTAPPVPINALYPAPSLLHAVLQGREVRTIRFCLRVFLERGHGQRYQIRLSFEVAPWTRERMWRGPQSKWNRARRNYDQVVERLCAGGWPREHEESVGRSCKATFCIEAPFRATGHEALTLWHGPLREIFPPERERELLALLGVRALKDN